MHYLLPSLLLLPICHYVADFELQTNCMSLGKSKSIKWLSIHVGIYAACFTVVFGPVFGIITFVTHFLTDYVTSRWTTKLWFLPLKPLQETPWIQGYGVQVYWTYERETRHRFFCVIGLDQMIHAYTLIFTVFYLDARPWFL